MRSGAWAVRRPRSRPRSHASAIADEPVRVAALHALARVSGDLGATLGDRARASRTLADDPSPAIRAALACLLASRGSGPACVADPRAVCSMGPTRTTSWPASMRSATWRSTAGRQDRGASVAIPRPRVRAAAAGGSVAGSRDADALAPDLDRPPRRRRTRRPRAAAAETLAAWTTPTGLLDMPVRRFGPRPGGGARRAPRPRACGPRRAHRVDAARRLDRASDTAPSAARASRHDGPCRGRHRPRRWASSSRSSPTASAASSTSALGPWSSSVRPRPAASSVERFGPTIAEIRAQAIEALDSIGDRRLTRGARRAPRRRDRRRCRIAARCLTRLADDDDPWISAPGATGRRVGRGRDAGHESDPRRPRDDAVPAPRPAVRGPRARGPPARSR